MPLKCFEKPNRRNPRLWSAKRAGQAVCYALKAGATRAQVEAEIAKCPAGDRRPEADEAAEALAQAERALLENNVFLDADAQLFERFLASTQTFAVAARIIARIPGPLSKVAAASLLGVRELASSRLRDIATQKAANDAAIAIVRRAAANAGRFRQTGT